MTKKTTTLLDVAKVAQDGGTVLPTTPAVWAWSNWDDANLDHDDCPECSAAAAAGDAAPPEHLADVPTVAAATRRLTEWGYVPTLGPADGEWNRLIVGNNRRPVPQDRVDAIMRAAFTR